jgi:hypothetical protein
MDIKEKNEKKRPARVSILLFKMPCPWQKKSSALENVSSLSFHPKTFLPMHNTPYVPIIFKV